MVVPCPLMREKREVTWPPQSQQQLSSEPLWPVTCILAAIVGSSRGNPVLDQLAAKATARSTFELWEVMGSTILGARISQTEDGGL